MKQNVRRKVTPKMIGRMVELREEGLPCMEIARRLNLSYSTVYNYLKEEERVGLIKRSLNLLDRNKKIVYPVSLAIIIFGFSIYFTLRTTDLRVAQQSDINMMSNAFLADANSGQIASSYQEIAKEWFYLSESARNSANLRCASAIACLWGFFSLLITFPFLFLRRKIWFIPFCIAIAFFALALIIHIFVPNYLTNAMDRINLFPFMDIMKRDEKFENVINAHDFLQQARIDFYQENPSIF